VLRVLLLAVAFAPPLWLGRGLIGSAAPTYDEPVHLAVGYADLLNPRYSLHGSGHPPLAEMWAAAPLLPLKPYAFFADPALAAGKVYDYADRFLYKNRLPPEALLDRARLWCLATWTLVTGAGVLLWSQLAGGAAAAWFGAWLFAFCVPLFSNAALVTTDAAPTALFFWTFLLLRRAPRSPGSWAGAGFLAGLAMCSKYNLFLAPPLAAMALLVESDVGRKREKLAPIPPRAYALLGLGVLAALCLVYRFRLGEYWSGLQYTFRLLDEGRSSFFWGRHSVNGHPLYFPAAFLLKTPLALLIAGALGAAGLLRRPDRGGFWLLAPAAAYFLAACASKIQIGYRHLLPIYPFFVVAGALGLAKLWERPWGRALALGLCAWLAVSVARVHPHHLAYFNEMAGGPDGGHRYLVDSNLDWGQGLKELGAELERRGRPPVVLCYFGSADPSWYGIRYRPFGFVSNVERREGVASPGPRDPLLLAISATNLHATYYADKKAFEWLAAKTPVFTAAHSIFLYDLTGDPDAARMLQ
jgi:hypothetical protein